MDHVAAAELAIERLKSFEGITRIVLYGSVARNEHDEKSDIDVAAILDDYMRCMPQLPFIALPQLTMAEGEKLTDLIQKEYGKNLHLRQTQTQAGLSLPFGDREEHRR